MQLERQLKEQHDSNQQQLASFLATNASLRAENVALRNAILALSRLDGTTHRMDAPASCRSPMQSKSTNNFSPSRRQPRRHRGLPSGERVPSPQRILDPGLRALDDISALPFVHSILNQEAPPHFVLPKFQMYYGLEDPFDHLMHRQIMNLQRGNNALLGRVFSSSLAGPSLSWFYHLALKSVTSFHRLFEKFVSQYMC